MALKSDGRSQLSGSGSIPAGPSDDAWHSTAAQPRLYRHGIARLFVAMNISGGTGISSIHRWHQSVKSKKFLVKIYKAVLSHLDVHVLCDNYTPQAPVGSELIGKAPPGSTYTSPPMCSS